MNCPFIASDPTFATTLVDFTRRRGITTVFVSHAQAEDALVGKIEESLLSSADVTLKFWRYDLGGKEGIAFRVATTRGMNHNPDHYSIQIRKGQLEIGVKAKQFRFDGSSVATVPIKLFLHSEGSIQDVYNEEIRASLRPVLSRNVDLDSGDRTHIIRWLALNAFSTVDEVQILQLDEFQLPKTSKTRSDAPPKGLAEIQFANEAGADVSELVREIQSSLLERTLFKGLTHGCESNAPASDTSRFFALPYFQNVGILVANGMRSDLFDGKAVSWENIVCEAANWESSMADNRTALFLDFACDKNETYISLFLEMAMGFGVEKPGPNTPFGGWLESNKEMLVRVLQAYALLAHRAHRVHPGKSFLICEADDSASERLLREGPYLWRHWYTTASQMFSKIQTEFWPDLRVSLLPNNACVAGEWYLTIPSYSAAPEFGGEILRQLISRDEEFERLRQGVGLPVRNLFYDPERIGSELLRSRYFSLPARETGEALAGALKGDRKLWTTQAFRESSRFS